MSATDSIESTATSAVRAVYPSLRDRRVLITGGGSGIGEVMVEEFVRQGARVAFIDVVDEASRALVERLSDEAETPPSYFHCDLRDLKALDRCLDAIGSDVGDVELLVNNAANDDRHAIDDITPEYWDERMAVNLRHMFFCAQAVAPRMRAAGGGAILNLGSVSWHLALPDLVVYQTAKAGVQGLTRSLARDLGQHGIRVNCIVPGAVRTARQDELWHDAEENARILNGQCLKERIMPADVAALALFLASDDARMCTGHAYFVDAGLR